MFLYFRTTEPKVVDGKKDYEALKACSAMEEEFTVRALSNILREFTCIRIDVSKADAKALETYGVREAPTCIVLDLEGHMTSLFTGAVGFGVIDLDLQDCLLAAEKEIRNLAKDKKEEPKGEKAEKEDPKVVRARAVLAEIEVRETYARGEQLFQRAQWDKAAETFQEAARLGGKGNFYAERLPVMLAEIKAARLYFEAIEDLRTENRAAAREKLERIVFEIKEAVCFIQFAKAALAKF